MSYEDMLKLPHPVSQRHKRMDRLDRAAQFAPFAALTGHEVAIKETARLTEEEIELDENSKELLDFRLQYLQEHMSEQPEVTVTYFCPDEKKAGGAYETMTGKVKKVDAYAGELVFTDGRRIALGTVIELEGEY